MSQIHTQNHSKSLQHATFSIHLAHRLSIRFPCLTYAVVITVPRRNILGFSPNTTSSHRDSSKTTSRYRYSLRACAPENSWLTLAPSVLVTNTQFLNTKDLAPTGESVAINIYTFYWCDVRRWPQWPFMAHRASVWRGLLILSWPFSWSLECKSELCGLPGQGPCFLPS